MARGDSAFNARLAYSAGVQSAVRRERDAIAGRARASFASHDRPGGHTITTENNPPDALVWLEGPAPVALEFGHVARDGSWVGGLNILARAARR